MPDDKKIEFNAGIKNPTRCAPLGTTCVPWARGAMPKELSLLFNSQGVPELCHPSSL